MKTYKFKPKTKLLGNTVPTNVLITFTFLPLFASQRLDLLTGELIMHLALVYVCITNELELPILSYSVIQIINNGIYSLVCDVQPL